MQSWTQRRQITIPTTPCPFASSRSPPSRTLSRGSGGSKTHWRNRPPVHLHGPGGLSQILTPRSQGRTSARCCLRCHPFEPFAHWPPPCSRRIKSQRQRYHNLQQEPPAPPCSDRLLPRSLPPARTGAAHQTHKRTTRAPQYRSHRSRQQRHSYNQYLRRLHHHLRLRSTAPRYPRYPCYPRYPSSRDKTMQRCS